METSELQKGTIGKAFFIKEICKEIEDLFISKYKNLKISNLTESFFIDLKTFNDLISENKSKTFCKFYYTQNGTSLNLGLSFSDNEGCKIENEDIETLYALDGNVFKKQNINSIVSDFHKGLGTELYTRTKLRDTLVYYSLEEINTYLQNMKGLYPTIYALKFNMWQYCPTNLNRILAAEFTKRNNRISFCVHALYNQKDKSYDESIGYDLGNLRP